MRRGNPWGILLFCLLGSAFGCGDDDARTEVVPRIARWERFEATLPRPVSEANPFDPEQISVDVELLGPAGEASAVPAFVWRDFTRELVGGYEKVRPAGDLVWKARFTPTEVGRWSWRWRVATSTGIETGPWNALDVTAPLPGAHGFVRRSPRDERYLEHDDGTAFWAVGENLSWYDGRGTFAYDDWLAKLAAQGCNYVRLWMPSWAFGLEWIQKDGDGQLLSTSLGNYRDRLDRAWQLDHVLETAARHGIHVMLAIQYHGAFSLTSNTEWADNPYNRNNGGPLTTPRELFTDPEAIALVKRRLRYIVARWGYSPHLLAWELWNEADLAEPPSVEAMTEWHRDMARELRRLDRHDHLISTSSSARDQLSQVWALPEIDFTQIHYYAFEGLSIDFPMLLPSLSARFRRFAKPVLFGEVGVDLRGPDETLRRDPDADGFHDILWTGLVSETFGSGMSWWWDNVVDPQNLYFHFGPLAAFTRAVDFPGEGFQSRAGVVPRPTGGSLRIAGLYGENTVLVWIKNAKHNWFSPDPSLVEGSTLSLSLAPGARWRVRWFDTRTGAVEEGGVLSSSQAAAALPIPAFRRDIALRLDRQG